MNGGQNTGIFNKTPLCFLISSFLFFSIEIRRVDLKSKASFTVDLKIPWYGKYGLYNHFHAETKENTIRYFSFLYPL